MGVLLVAREGEVELRDLVGCAPVFWVRLRLPGGLRVVAAYCAEGPWLGANAVCSPGLGEACSAAVRAVAALLGGQLVRIGSDSAGEQLERNLGGDTGRRKTPA